jgi:hypothetical protein
VKVLIATPLYAHPTRQFTESLFALSYYTARTSDIELCFANATGTILPQNREALVAAARQQRADHILFIDGDQSFPQDTLIRLLAHRLDVVGCNIRLRSGGTSAVKDGKQLVSTRAKALEQVDLLGLGVCLIAMSVFDRLRAPYFRYALMDRGAGVELVGEDYGFFNTLLSAGIPAYVDHALSMEVGHVSETVLRF